MDRIKQIEKIIKLYDQHADDYIGKSEVIQHLKYLLEDNKRLREEIGTAIYELQRLERNIDIPERGYVRNCFNGVVRTLEQALREDGK